MKIIGLIVHKYAPELNKALILAGGKTHRMSCPSCFTIAEARKKLFPQPFKGLHCRIDSTYNNGKYSNLNRIGVASGRIESRLQALRFSKKYQQSGGELLNGEILPPNNVRLTFKFN